MAYVVKIMLRAQADLDGLCEWMTSQVPVFSQEWFEGLVEAIKSLQEYPNRCALAPEFRAKGVRHLLYGKGRYVYRILFRVRNKSVEVLTVRHGVRKPLKG